MEESEKRRIQRRRRIRQKRKRQRRMVLTGLGILAVCVLCIIIFAIKSIFFSKEDTEKGKSSKAVSETVKEKKKKGKSSAVITLNGDKMIQIKLGETFHDPGYTAEDKDGTDLSSKVEVDTSALKRAGKQKVLYKVKGNNGVEEETVREVEVLPNTEYGSKGLPICMYHYVYETESPPENLDSNFISTDALEEEMKYLQDNGYYFPTWQEVREYVEGKLLLPEKSIVLTFDDGPNYMNLGIPILEKYKTPATSFVITSYWDNKEMLYGYASDYLSFQSHSYKMHQGGGNSGHGGIYTAMTKEEVLNDLQKSFEICGNQDAFAYPFGDYTEEGCAVLEEAGLLCAVTTENAKCYPGDNPYLLPRVRMLGTQTIEEFISLIE